MLQKINEFLRCIHFYLSINRKTTKDRDINFNKVNITMVGIGDY